MFGWGKPKVSVAAVYAVAKAAGIMSFSDLLDKALANGQVSEQQAAELRAKAANDEVTAQKDLARAVAAANQAFDASMAGVAKTETQADQKAAEAGETLAAVSEFKKAMGADKK
jgi:hypothetical protein